MSSKDEGVALTTATGAGEAGPQPLPRGRHGLSRDAVRTSQRARLIAAMLDQVAARGYAAVAVRDVVAAARVSRNAFYELFEDKQDCFLAAADEVGTEILELMFAQTAQPSWDLALREGIRDYLRFWRERPGFAVAYLVEMPAAGRRAHEQRDRAYERFGRMFEALAARARAEQPGLAPLPPLVPRLVTAAVTELLATEARAGRLDRIDEIADDLYEFIARSIAPAS